MISRKIAALVGVLGVSSCGSSNLPDVATYQALLTQVSAVVSGHLDAGTQVGTVSDCIAEYTGYDGQVRPLASQMAEMSGDMDSCMCNSGSGDPTAGHFQSTCAAMLTELGVHANAACQSADNPQNWAETRRHCDAMTSLLSQEQADAATMGGSQGCHR